MSFAIKNEATGAIVGFTDDPESFDMFKTVEIFTFEELPPVQVEEGKYYFTRNLAVFGPIVPVGPSYYNEEWKWSVARRTPGQVWRDDGTYGNNREYDLMCEYIA